MFSGAVLVRSDAQFDFEELSLIAFALGVGVAAARNVLLFVVLMVVFALGVGVGVGRTVRASFTLTALRPFALEVGVGVLAAVRLFVIFAFDLGMVVAAFGLGVGVGVCSLYIFDLLLLRLVAFGFGVGVGCPALAAPMLPARVIAVIANVFSSVFLIFILPTTKSIAGRALLFLSFCARILCSPANHPIEEWSYLKDGRQLVGEILRAADARDPTSRRPIFAVG